MSITLGRRKFYSLDKRRSFAKCLNFAIFSGDGMEKFSMLSRLRTSLGSRVTKVLLKSDLLGSGECCSLPPNPGIMSTNCLVEMGKLFCPI